MIRGFPSSQWLWLCLVLVVSGCASKAFVGPVVGSATFVERGDTQIQGGVQVTAAVPGADETKTIIGLDLYSQGIQPVWLNVTNLEDAPVRVALVSIDEEYFSPLEVAWQNRGQYSGDGRVEMERWFYENQMPRRILPGETRAGFVFTHLTQGTKGFNVDVYTIDGSANFTFFIAIPGFQADHMDVNFKDLYTADELQEFDDAEGLRSELEKMACCSTDQSGIAEGDPINVALVGAGLSLRRALLRGDWQETASGSPATTMARTHRYKGRQPDGIFHKSRPDGTESKELRVWLSPMLVDGVRVWLGQVSYEMGGNTETALPTAYFIDPDVDDARMFLMQNFWYSQSLSGIGFVEGGAASTIDTPKSNFHGSEYFTDGLRLVLFVSASPVGLDDTEMLNWSELK